ncbi:MAG: glutamate racemase [Patescibacteria group bacterium]|nr:glutamate racemase [Patescibacteria group bacterium]
MLGIFDSGLGGLTVARAVRKRLPEYQVCYLGDTARLPYGNRSADLIYRFTVEGVGFLLRRGCPLVIVACNSASAVALRRLQQEWLPKKYPQARVLGVVRPLAEHAAAVTRFSRIGVVGTRSTVASGAYQREITVLNPKAHITQAACPLLVPLIEEGWGNRPETKKILRQYLRPLKRARVDTLVLGCTHYPMLRKEFAAVMGHACQVPDPAEVVAEKLADYLVRHADLAARITRGPAHQFLVTDQTEQFTQIASAWLGHPIRLETVVIEGAPAAS